MLPALCNSERRNLMHVEIMIESSWPCSPNLTADGSSSKQRAAYREKNQRAMTPCQEGAHRRKYLIYVELCDDHRIGTGSVLLPTHLQSL